MRIWSEPNESRSAEFDPQSGETTACGPRLDACPVCAGRRLHFAFSHQEYRVERCDECGFRCLNPQPSDAQLAAIYSAQYVLGGDTPAARERVAGMKQASARLHLADIARYRGTTGGKLLEIGCGGGDFLLEATRQGYQCTGVEYAVAAVTTARQRVPAAEVLQGEIESLDLPRGAFDICVLCDVLEHVRQPLETLRRIRELLQPDGMLYLTTPSLDSWSSRLLGKSWMEYKPEHLSYFTRETLQRLLYRAGFGSVLVGPGWKVLNLDYVAHHFERFPVPVFTSLVKAARWAGGRWLRYANVPVVASGVTVTGTRVEVPQRPRLSVIVPAYNEAATFSTLMKDLVRKQVPGVDLEIVVVESNSTDGTRELALRYEHHPRVRLVLEDRPRGKGHAVRAGLAQARGEFILIQDADLEYDLADYDPLVEPLIHGRANFVLGARHGGDTFKIRHFEGNRCLGGFLNFGHLIFTGLVNLLFGQGLKDPFTMYKVFRRDCLAGLTFRCNRFDFDFELLILLLRKGYQPLEIPVNYRSRSFKEGKKVRMFRDPLTWLWTLARLRLTGIDPARAIGRQRQQPSSRTVSEPTRQVG